MGTEIVPKEGKRTTMRASMFISAAIISMIFSTEVHCQKNDSQPHEIPMILPKEWFIPAPLLFGFQPWESAPLLRPSVIVMPEFGFLPSVGFGSYSIQHPDRFFSTLEGYNMINIPQMYISRQMMLGNTFRIGRRIYYMSGILYGSRMGTMGNNWGIGTREGFIVIPSDAMSISLWTQYYQSLSVYSPVVIPVNGESGAAIVMPATPEVFSLGIQTRFVAGEFIIGVGTSFSPVPFQKRRHSELRYR